jgi:hypothetical protein
MAGAVLKARSQGWDGRAYSELIATLIEGYADNHAFGTTEEAITYLESEGLSTSQYSGKKGKKALHKALVLEATDLSKPTTSTGVSAEDIQALLEGDEDAHLTSE